ncbi:MAG: hypothetical protein R8J85_10485 [Mariprofundales bacterium]
MLKEALDTTYLHFNRAKDNYSEIIEQNIDASIYSDKERIKTIDAFIFRFIKVQDFMGDKLFKLLLMRVGEYKDNMSLIDVLDKMEKLEILTCADRWLEFRVLRNKLTHEYPESQEETLQGIQSAVACFKEIQIILHSIVAYIQTKHLLE